MQESRRMGGIEHNSLELARALRQLGTYVAFLCPARGMLTDFLDREGFPYEILKRPRFLSTSSRFGSRYFFNPFTTLYNFLLFLPLVLRITLWLKERRPSLVVTKGLLVNFYGGLGARAAGCPVLWDVEEIVSEKKALGLVRWILNYLARLLPTHITANAEATGAQFGSALRRKVTVIANGVSLKRFDPRLLDPMVFRKELGIGRNLILIGHVGRFTYWKGQLEFIQAAAQIAKVKPDVRFVLVGAPVFENDAYERRMKKLVNELGLERHVFFPGYRRDFERVLAALDIFVHSSLEPEGCPLTLVSAMAMEKPVVATRIPGNSEVVQDSVNGVFVEPGNPSDIAGAVLALLESPEKMKMLGRAARERVQERFSIEQFALETLAVMQRLEQRSPGMTSTSAHSTPLWR